MKSVLDRLVRRAESVMASPAGWGDITLHIRNHQLQDHFHVMVPDTLDRRQVAHA